MASSNRDKNNNTPQHDDLDELAIFSNSLFLSESLLKQEYHDLPDCYSTLDFAYESNSLVSQLRILIGC